MRRSWCKMINLSSYLTSWVIPCLSLTILACGVRGWNLCKEIRANPHEFMFFNYSESESACLWFAFFLLTFLNVVFSHQSSVFRISFSQAANVPNNYRLWTNRLYHILWVDWNLTILCLTLWHPIQCTIWRRVARYFSSDFSLSDFRFPYPFLETTSPLPPLQSCSKVELAARPSRKLSAFLACHLARLLKEIAGDTKWRDDYTHVYGEREC